MTTPPGPGRPDQRAVSEVPAPSGMADSPERRRRELRAGLQAVRGRIAAACAEADRLPEEVTLVVVTKFFPAADVRLLHEIGVRAVGESRHQEGVAKRAELSDLDLTWHFVGPLQSNKAAAVGGWADVVHSLDRAKLVAGLARGAQERQADLDVLVQVSLDGPGRQGGNRRGVPPEQAADLAAHIAGSQRLRLAGVMGVAPPDADPAAAFALLARTWAHVRARTPSADWMSAGMSGDLEHAVAAGATHVRVGSAVLGNRPARR